MEATSAPKLAKCPNFDFGSGIAVLGRGVPVVGGARIEVREFG